MALDRFTLWHLELIREVVARAAPRVSLSFFWWSKPPGNFYTTFYPTDWLPSPGDLEGLRDPSRGREIFRRTMTASRVTLATYGDQELQIPWLTTDEHAVVLSPKRDRDPRRAAGRALASLDLDWLANEGRADPPTTRVVLAWLDEILSLGRGPEIDRVNMEFEFNEQPSALRVVEVGARDAGGREVGWREPLDEGAAMDVSSRR